MIHFLDIQTTLNAFIYIYSDLFKVCLNKVEQKTSRSFFFLWGCLFAHVTNSHWKPGVTWEEWPSGLKGCDGNLKVLVPYYMLTWAWGPNPGSLWPSGQNLTYTIINMELERLSPQEWSKIDCEASKLQIEKKNCFSNKDIVTRGGFKKSLQLVWNLQLIQKAIHNVRFLESINNHIFHYKCWLCSIVFYIWWCISIKTVDLRLLLLSATPIFAIFEQFRWPYYPYWVFILSQSKVLFRNKSF